MTTPTAKGSSTSGSGSEQNRGKVGIRSEGLYGGEFNDTISDLFSPEHLADTIKAINDLKKSGKAFEAGDSYHDLFGPAAYQKFFANGGWERYIKDFKEIPSDRRDDLTMVMRTNFESASPKPIRFGIASNVSNEHDIIIKNFTVDEVLYIGVMFLCPSPDWGYVPPSMRQAT